MKENKKERVVLGVSFPVREDRNENGELHRLDGPAYVLTGDNGRREYWIDGKHLTEEEFYDHPDCTAKR